MTVIASPGQGPDRSTEVSYTDTKVKLGNFYNMYFCDRITVLPPHDNMYIVYLGLGPSNMASVVGVGQSFLNRNKCVCCNS